MYGKGKTDQKMKRMKKNKMKIFLSFLAGIWLFAMAGRFGVLAESALKIGIDQFEVTDDGDIFIYVNQSEGNGFQPQVEESLLLVGKNRLAVREIRTFIEIEEPVTYLCLVDISGSMTQEGIAQTKEILKQFAQAKKEQDNICITTMGNDVRSSGFLTGRDEVEAAADGIERINTEDTNLYYSIKEAVNVLKTDKAVHKKRCLLIFSDGEDDQKKGITEQEAQNAVKENHIPVFTIAMPGVNLKDAEESVKILGSFARNSAGGEHFAPLLDERYEYADICSMVNERLQTSLVIGASLENVKEVGDDTVYIGVELSDGDKKATDGITVPVGNILEAIEKEQKGTEVQVTEINDNPATELAQESEEEPAEEPKKLYKPVLIGILLFIMVLILAFIAFLKNKSEDEFNDDEYGEEVCKERPVISGISYDGDRTLSEEGSRKEDVEQKLRKHLKKEQVEVILFRVGPGEAESHKMTVKDSITIGRNKGCQLSFKNDSALSGIHCSILYHDGGVFVKDEGSTNGTYVNGVAIVGEFKVEKDDILLIGSSEFRITWE